MKLPKYIDKLLYRRAILARFLLEIDWTITEFLHRNNIEADTADYCGGVEIYVNPEDSAERVRQAIINKELL